jgi:hypothetical protein
MEEARRIREDGVNAHNLSVMIAHYNQLVGRFNTLWNGCLEVGKEFDRQQAEARRELLTRDERIADLERQLAAEKATVQCMRAHAYDMMILRLDQEKERREREAARSQQG